MLIGFHKLFHRILHRILHGISEDIPQDAVVVQQLSYKLNQVTKSGDTRLGSDPRLYVAMVHVELLLCGIHVKIAPQLVVFFCQTCGALSANNQNCNPIFCIDAF